MRHHQVKTLDSLLECLETSLQHRYRHRYRHSNLYVRNTDNGHTNTRPILNPYAHKDCQDLWTGLSIHEYHKLVDIYDKLKPHIQPPPGARSFHTDSSRYMKMDGDMTGGRGARLCPRGVRNDGRCKKKPGPNPKPKARRNR